VVVVASFSIVRGLTGGRERELSAGGMAGRRVLTLVVLLGLCGGVHGAGRTENRFGSIHIDGKKAGQIHYTIEYGDGGDVESLRTRASLSILGIKVFNFDQNLHEQWRHGELQELRGRTDDDGKIFDASLQRGPEAFNGSLNGKPVGLPDTAFPASVWHYRIVDRPLLFDLKAFTLMNVKTARSDETITLPNRRKVPTERVDFSGDWRATAWFDRKHEVVQFKYVVDGHDVVVRLDD
jgi:uncharacterized protein DUF6134